MTDISSANSAMTGANGFWRLVRLQTRMRLGLSVLRARVRKGGKTAAVTILAGIGLAIVALSLLFSYGILLYALLKAAIEVGLGPILLAGIFVAAMIVILIFGTLMLLTMVFQASDIPFYAALPVSGQSVFLSKFVMVYLSELMLAFFMLLPPVAIYLAITGVTLQGVAGFLLVLPFVPLPSLGLGSVLAFGLSRLSILSRKKDLLLIILGIVFLFFAFYMQVTLNNLARESFLASQQVIASLQPYIDSVTAAFPPAKWAVAFFTLPFGQAVWQYILFLTVGAVALGAAGYFCGRGYYTVVLSQQEIAKRGGRALKQNSLRTQTPFRSLLMREWRILFRSPVYLLNTLPMAIILPILILVYAQMNDPEINAVLQALHNLQGPYYLSILIIAGLCLFPGLMNMVSSSAVSREGKAFWLARLIPVRMQTQVRAKAAAGALFAAAGAIVGAASLYLFLNLPLSSVLPGLFVALCAAWPSSVASLYLDILRPKLDWLNEAQAMKQNLNSVLSVFPALLSLLPSVGVFLLAKDAVNSPWPLALFLGLTLIVTGFIADFLMATLADTRLGARDV